MKHSIKFLIIFSISCVFLFTLNSFKSQNFSCSNLKNGTFHFYKENGRYHSLITRKDSIQTEVNLNTGDTTKWRVTWTSDCEFNAKYISGSKIKSQQEIDFYDKSTLKFTITGAKENYYTYEALMTYNNTSRKFSDTMWLKEK